MPKEITQPPTTERHDRGAGVQGISVKDWAAQRQDRYGEHRRDHRQMQVVGCEFCDARYTDECEYQTNRRTR